MFYSHTVHYYETDKMGIVHHSNYIRWMEEARIYFLAQLGFPFDQLEQAGLGSPVVAVSGRYLLPTYFGEEIAIVVTVADCRGVKLSLNYDMTNPTGQLVYTGTSEHCFLNQEGKPVNIKKTYPELFVALMSQKN